MSGPTDPELQPLFPPSSNPSTTQHPPPLLPSDRQYLRTLHGTEDLISRHIRTIHGPNSWVTTLRKSLQHFLSSKWGHYFVITLVAADISCIFADFLISLHVCEHGGEKGFPVAEWDMAAQVLDVMSLVFSCLFVAELLASVFAFGFRYFSSPFHTFDAIVILTAFLIDLILHAGPLEEAGSLVVVLRLWRVFKIIEEFSSGAEDSIAELQEKIEELKREKDEVVKENGQLRSRSGVIADGSGQ